MFQRTLQRLFLHAFLMVCVVIGPVGTAFANTDGCAPDCPCDDEAEHTDDHGDDVEASEVGAVDACGDQCSDCDCSGGLVAAVMPPSLHLPRGVTHVRKVAPRPDSIAIGANPDIFRPPRAQR